MKKIVAVLLAAMMMIGMFSCVAIAEEDDGIVIGILAPATTHGWVGGVAYFAQQAADAAKADGRIADYKLSTSSNEEEMSSQIEQMISMGVDGIVVWPQFTGVEKAADMALEAGIPIYNFDMKIEASEDYADKLYVLTGDNYGMGAEGAKYIAEKLEGQGKVLVLCKPGAGNVNDDRMAGFNDTIAEIAPDIEVIAEIATDFVREQALSDMADALTAYPEIDAVFSLDDETSIGALQAIKEAGRTDVKAITGGGGCQEYFNMMQEDDYADIWVSSATYAPDMIVDCIDNLIAALSGEEIEHEIVKPTTIVDRDNVAEFLNADSPY
ncbi:MAG: substrate-binding domain-containing protein [Clostridia bacterium]|nr:substrate-binding domain-containing protein [Clostridia bacterium]